MRTANDTIQAAFATGHSRNILKTTMDFHELLFRIADKPVAWQVVQGLNERINQLRAMTVAQPQRATDADEEMRRIIDAIAARDPEGAARASFEHVDRVKRLALAVLAQQSGKPPSI